MATKTIDKTPISIEALRAKLEERLTGTPLDIPDWGTVEVAMLTNIEIQKINDACRRADGTTDASLWNRMSASFGLVSPKMTPEECGQYPQEFIIPIANKVWELTNAYSEKREKDADEPVNFPKRSGSSSGSLIESTSTSTSLKDIAKPD